MHHPLIFFLCFRLPSAPQLQFCFAVIAVQVIAFGFDQHQFPGFCHDHKIGIMVNGAIETEAFTLDNAVPSLDVWQADNHVNQFALKVIYFITQTQFRKRCVWVIFIFGKLE